MKYWSLFIALLALNSCEKKKESELTNECKLTNYADRTIRLRFYNTLDDYNNNKNIVATESVEAKQTKSMTLPGSSYYYDWYTDDYKLHNWYNSPHFAIRGVDNIFTPSIKMWDNQYGLYESITWLAFLSDGKEKTNWVNVTYPGVPATDIVTLTVNKSFIATYTRTLNGAVKDSGTCEITMWNDDPKKMDIDVAKIKIGPQGDTTYSNTGSISAYLSPPAGTPTPDTIYFYLYGAGKYKMQKIK